LLVEQHVEAVEAPSQLVWLEQMIGRRRRTAERALRRRERFVDHDASWRERRGQVREQIALQIPADHNEIESRARQRRARQVRAPARDVQAFAAPRLNRLAYGF